MPFTFDILETTFLTGFGEWTYGTTGKTAKRTWTVNCSQMPASFADIDAVAALLPSLGSQESTGDDRYVQKVTIRAVAGSLDVLYAEAEYGPNQYEANPLLRKDVVSLEVGGATESWFVDSKGNPAVTSAGEIFEKLPPRTTGGVKLVIEGNRATIPAQAMVGLSQPSHTNTSAIAVRGISLEAKQAKLVGCSSSEQTENGVTYHKVRWELELAPKWDIDIDDRGFIYKDASGLLKPIMVGEPPEKTPKPWPLDGAGGKKANASDVPATVNLVPYPDGDFDFGWTSAA